LILFRSDLLSLSRSALPPIRLTESPLPSIPLSITNLQNLLPLKAATAAHTIAASEASEHLGERTTVCGRIASERIAASSRGRPTFVNLAQPDPERVFTVRVWGRDRASVGAIPSSGMLCATGVITSYRGTPEIAVKDAKSWYVPR
jgi:hypothetical protein